MTDQIFAPSPVIEALLSSLGARPEIRDAVLGDLHQTMLRIADSDGAPAARRWYRREALRAAPHLVRDAAFRSYTFADGRRLMNAAACSAVLSLTLAVMAYYGGVAVWMSFSDGPRFPGQELPRYYWLVATMTPMLAGGLAAALEDQSPLAAVAALLSIRASLQLFVLTLVIRSGRPLQWDLASTLLLNLLWFAAASLAGGLISVAYRRRTVEPPSSSPSAAEAVTRRSA